MTHLEPTLRALETSDAEAVFRIIDASHKLAGADIGSHWSLDQVRSECSDAMSLAACGERGELLGFILYRDAFDAWEISFLATSPESRGRGVMRTLLGALVARRPSGKALWLEVHEANRPARQLYEAFGFQLVGKRPKYYADGGTACLYNYG